MSNLSDNKRVIDSFRKELKSMLADISEIDVRCLNKAVSKGLAVAKRNTSVITGFMRRSWKSTPTAKSRAGAEKSIENTADYASFVNDGHRVVRKGITTGFVKGQFILEKAVNKVDAELAREFKSEIERVNREHDK